MVSRFRFRLASVIVILLIVMLGFSSVSYASFKTKRTLGNSLIVGEIDPYKNTLNISAPVMWSGRIFTNSPQYHKDSTVAYSLRYTKFPAGHSTIRLFFTYFSFNFCFIKTAIDINSNEPKLYFINRRELRFVVPPDEDRAETFAITLSEEYLNSHFLGIKLRTYGSRCNVDLDIPGHYIQKFLHKIKSK